MRFLVPFLSVLLSFGLGVACGTSWVAPSGALAAFAFFGAMLAGVSWGALGVVGLVVVLGVRQAGLDALRPREPRP